MRTSVEKLLDAQGPVWYQWDGDARGLVRELAGIAEEHRETARRTGEWLRFRRLIWLLDRLATASEAALFEPLIDDTMALFAWGRRLPSPQRDRILRVTSSPSDDRRLQMQAAMLAWCESCPNRDVAPLLTWPEIWRPALDRHDVCWLPHPEDDFYRRCPSHEARRDQLSSALDYAISHLAAEDVVEREIAQYSGRAVLHWLLLSAARESACPSEREPHSTREWAEWLDRELAEPRFASVRSAARELITGASHEYWARHVWVQCHGLENWRHLYESLAGHPDWVNTHFHFDRLAEIVPKNELEVWDNLVLREPRDSGQMRAFCRWLPPEFVDALRAHFDHPDGDWAGCAFQNYLAKASEAILQHWWRQMDRLPLWQIELLDRRLFAPTAVRPSPILEDVQTVEGDLRLQDPFNARAY